MLNDITIGQYFPGKSIIHRLDPRTKLFLSLILIVSLFIPNSPFPLVFGVLFCITGYILSGVPMNLAFKSIKPVIPIIIFTAILNLCFNPNGNVIFKIFNILITDLGIKICIMMIIRIVFLIIGSSLLTYTTSTIELTDALESIMKPLERFKFPAHELAMMITIALRFIPTLIEETNKIMSAQKARGATLDNGSLIERSKALVPILVPLFVSSFKRADELAVAMECRCYHGGEGRTRMKKLKYKLKDLIFYILGILLIVVTIYFNTKFVKVL